MKKDRATVRDGAKQSLILALEAAETEIGIWAEVLADEGDDSMAAEALRLKNTVLHYRCEIGP